MRKIVVFTGLFIVLFGCNAQNATQLDATNPQPSPTISTTAPAPINTTTMGADWTPEWNQVVAYWSLDGSAGSVVANGSQISSDVGADGVANNPNGTGMSYVSVQSRTALNLDGVDDFVDLNTTVADLPGGYSPRTVCGWGMMNSTSGGYSWIASWGTAGGDSAMFIGNLGTTLNGGGYGDDLTVNNFWSVGVWHHICLTFDGTDAALYADGALVAGPTPKNWNLVKSVAYLGKQVNGFEYWPGSIAEVAIWSTALTAQEIETIYTRQAPKF